MRRLNRAEYNNTVRDMLGVDWKPAADFPPDDSGFGFDNIADVLSVSPMLTERYLAAARKIPFVLVPIPHPIDVGGHATAEVDPAVHRADTSTTVASTKPASALPPRTTLSAFSR